MKYKLFSAITLSIISVLVSAQSLAKEQGTLRQCQNTKDKIEYYTNLRRSGGSPRTMENWKQKRDYHKDKYSDQNCKKWRGKLK